jgi:hypothetical protein
MQVVVEHPQRGLLRPAATFQPGGGDHGAAR